MVVLAVARSQKNLISAAAFVLVVVVVVVVVVADYSYHRYQLSASVLVVTYRRYSFPMNLYKV